MFLACIRRIIAAASLLTVEGIASVVVLLCDTSLDTPLSGNGGK
jgi:hypothetical protein